MITLRSTYMKESPALRWDYVLGSRAWGLALYGSLPACLAALGFGKPPSVPDLQGTNLQLWFTTALAVTVPIATLSLLVRQRLAAWYLSTEMLLARTFVIMLMIGTLSCGITYATGSSLGKYDGDTAGVITVHVVIVGAVSLIVSSGLFLAAIRSDSGLPLLPTADEVKSLDALRTELDRIRTAPIWDREAAGLDELEQQLSDARNAVDTLKREAAGSGRAGFYETLGNDVEQLEQLRSDTAKNTLWVADVLADSDDGLPDAARATRKSVLRLGATLEAR